MRLPDFKISSPTAALYRPCCSLSFRALFAAFRDGSRTIAKPSASAKHFFAHNRKNAFWPVKIAKAAIYFSCMGA